MSSTASESNGASHSEPEPKQAVHIKLRKHAVSDERYDEMGLILEPWRVSFQREDLSITAHLSYAPDLPVETIFQSKGQSLVLCCHELQCVVFFRQTTCVSMNDCR